MDKALVFGTKDCRFESCQGHIYSEHMSEEVVAVNLACCEDRWLLGLLDQALLVGFEGFGFRVHRGVGPGSSPTRGIGVLSARRQVGGVS